jgi:hypothetical protein
LYQIHKGQINKYIGMFYKVEKYPKMNHIFQNRNLNLVNTP